ncbi:domain found in IF2B/IF5-domain-containing protein [Microdochium trichocladiopsis]|uniref:Domain found in IF2B/IF5-domain-containing protein n=1 Tax=Microdochium trichocladiopsis TaxID=1682393 RepID=A0A9P8Y290_9PEZI|nr:domain found in IF2B/IF5-domain-containing protein [Microdochium trichocladiopsis]KAH7025838.1 domain found in IF2B/IF5-domain-containing protein [Microdochium trichocladiopsis]
MADTEEQRPSIPDRKQRKSVVFDSETTIVEADGKVTTMASPEETKVTAESHTPSTQPLSDALGAFTDPKEAPVDDAPPAEEGGLDLTMKKKKKKKVPKEGEEDAEAGDAPADGADGGLDLSIKKKKKKKVKTEEGDEFAAKLAALDLDKEGEGADAEAEGEEESGDMEKGTGIWKHDETKNIGYDLLLSRFFSLLSQKNPDHASTGSKSYKIPPPQCLREGNKKTIFANIPEICKRMKRTEEHVTAYLFAELGTSGSVDGSRRLVIKGRFQQKQIENVLRKYILEYVTCKTCRSPDTELNKGENRLYFITCNSCGSRRSVTAIKTGFSAQVGKRKKMRA